VAEVLKIIGHFAAEVVPAVCDQAGFGEQAGDRD
jgi:hypothetical protein